MSLFDNIKYPVSIPPTYEQLANLPTKIYDTWINHPKCKWCKATDETKSDKRWVAEWSRRQCGRAIEKSLSFDLHIPSMEIIEDTNLLRKIILEWEE